MYSNDKLTLALRSVGGAMVQLLMKDDPEQLNPLQGLGHFVCVDGFGPVSQEERAAGLPGHGEAHRVPWDVTSFDRTDGTLTVGFTARLPLVQEIFRRTIRMVDGESVVYIESELESLLGFDRPINWGEHATIGGPFLEQGKTVTEMSASRAQTRSYVSEAVEPPDHHNLADEKDFTWPIAPTADGGKVDVRVAPTIAPVMDQTTSLMDPSRRLVFVTAFHPDKKALFGYVFRREEYPWTQIWDSYPGGTRRSSRGMEFAAQPYDLPRRDVIRRQRDVRHADLPMAARPIEDRIELRHVLHAHARRVRESRRRQPDSRKTDDRRSRVRQEDDVLNVLPRGCTSDSDLLHSGVYIRPSGLSHYAT